MPNVGYATLSIIPSAKGFGSALGGPVNSAMGKAGTHSGGLFGKSVGGVLARVAWPLVAVAVVATVGAFVKSAIGGASELEQSMGAIDAIFKGSAGQMQAWSSTAARTVGLTKNEYNTLGTLLGAQLKNGGTSMDQLAGKTNSLIGVASDLSAQFGGSTSQAVEALSSALKGERDPIEKYGVSLTQAKIDAEAAALGFKKVGSTLSSEATQAATLSLIMKQTADAHGAFGRETDTLAHKQQVLNALWADGKARIGAELLPAVSAMASVLIGALGPAIDGTVKGMSFIGAAVDLAVGSFTGKGANVDLGWLTNPIITVGATIRTLFDGISAAVGPFVPQITAGFSALGPAVLGLLPLFNPLGLIFQALLPVLPQLAGMIAQLVAQLLPLVALVLPLALANFRAVGQFFAVYFAAALPLVADVFGAFRSGLLGLLPVVESLLSELAPLVAALLAGLAPLLGVLATEVLPIVAELIGLIAAAIAPVIATVAQVLVPTIHALQPVLSAVFDLITGAVTAAMEIVRGVLDVVTGLISGDWSRVWTGVQSVVSGVLAGVVNVVTGGLAAVRATITAALSIVGSIWSALWPNVVATFAVIWATFSAGFETAVGSVVGFFRGLPAQLVKVLSTVGGALVGVGRNIVEGLLAGLTSVAKRIAAALLGPITGIVSGVRSALGIHSPSRVLRDSGESIGYEIATAIAAAPSTPTVRPGGVRGAVDEVAARRAQHTTHRLAFEDRYVSGETKDAKLRRAFDLVNAHASATATA